MTDRFKAYADALDAIYAAAFQPERWSEAFEAVTGFLGCPTGGLTIVDLSGKGRYAGGGGVGTDPDYIRSFYAYYEPLYPGNPLIPCLPTGEVTANSRLIDRDAFRASVFYNEWAAPQEFCDTLLAVLHRSDRCIAYVNAIRHDRQGEADEAALADLGRLVPHLTRATQAGLALSQAQARAAGLGELLDRLTLATFSLDREGRILFANRAGEELLQSGQGLTASGGRLGARTAADANRLAAVLAQALAGEGGDLLLAGSDEAPIVLTFLPLPPATAGDLLRQERAAVVVFANNRRRAAGEEVATLAAAFGLTPAEQRVLVGVLAGQGLGAVAATLGIAVTTARTHLDRIFQKTGTARQAELVGLVANLAGPIRRGC